MTSREQLLRAILEAPADDFRRLVYADKCEDEGDIARAVFVRVQLQLALTDDELLAMLPEQKNACRGWRLDNARGHLTVRAHQLQLSASMWWCDYGPGDKVTVVEWQRGFATKIACTLKNFMAHAEAFFSLQPIEEVALTDVTPWQGLVSAEDTTDVYGWCWYGGLRESFDLPRPLFDLLSGGRRYYVAEDQLWEDFDSQRQALASLSNACVAYGRQQAGLPPIEIAERPGDL